MLTTAVSPSQHRPSERLWNRRRSSLGAAMHQPCRAVYTLRTRDLAFAAKLPAPHQRPLSLAEVDPFAVEVFEPRMAVAIGEPQKQALHLDTLLF